MNAHPSSTIATPWSSTVAELGANMNAWYIPLKRSRRSACSSAKASRNAICAPPSSMNSTPLGRNHSGDGSRLVTADTLIMSTNTPIPMLFPSQETRRARCSCFHGTIVRPPAWLKEINAPYTAADTDARRSGRRMTTRSVHSGCWLASHDAFLLV